MIQYLILLLSVAVSVSAKDLKVLSNAIPFKPAGGRVIGGDAAVVGQFPYQAALFLKVSSAGDVIFCGGSLVTTTHILSAGHCTYPAIEAVIFLGSIITQDLSADNYAAKKFTTHPSYSSNSLLHDIGLIELATPVTLTDNIKIIPLDFETLKENTQVTISGFGKTSDASSSISSVLRFASLTTITKTECDLTFGSIPSGVVCAKGATIQSVCSGDSGGPLTRINNTEVVQVAIVSFVHVDGCTLRRPSGFTRVAEYKDFIEKILNSGTSLKMMYTFEACLLFLIYLLSK